MQRYRVNHTTTYTYLPGVRLSHAVLHLRPADFVGQHINATTLVIDPAPDTLLESVDVFGNPTTWVSIERPHTISQYTSTLDITVGLTTEADPALLLPWEAVVSAATSGDRLDVRWTRQGSPYVVLDAQIMLQFEHELGAAFTPGRVLFDVLKDVLAWFAQSFRFDPTSTEVSTPIAEVLQSRAGVCQDFAHLAIAIFRARGFAARYTSGYLKTLSDAGGEHLVGADASHAWVSVWSGNSWIDIDPTNNILVADQHVRLAVGRDYSDVAPIKGVTIGPPHSETLSISVDTQLVG